jgi:uncharacterized protein YicC (UPF0701 family)
MSIEDEIKKVVTEKVDQGVDQLDLVCDQNANKLQQETTALVEKIRRDIQKIVDKEVEVLRKDMEKLMSDLKASFIKQSGGKKWFWLK